MLDVITAFVGITTAVSRRRRRKQEKFWD